MTDEEFLYELSRREIYSDKSHNSVNADIARLLHICLGARNLLAQWETKFEALHWHTSKYLHQEDRKDLNE
jgi:hypothetical protein